MDINTKKELLKIATDLVANNDWIPCESCNGTGENLAANKTHPTEPKYSCPVCKGKKGTGVEPVSESTVEVKKVANYSVLQATDTAKKHRKTIEDGTTKDPNDQDSRDALTLLSEHHGKLSKIHRDLVGKDEDNSEHHLDAALLHNTLCSHLYFMSKDPNWTAGAWRSNTLTNSEKADGMTNKVCHVIDGRVNKRASDKVADENSEATLCKKTIIEGIKSKNHDKTLHGVNGLTRVVRNNPEKHGESAVNFFSQARKTFGKHGPLGTSALIGLSLTKHPSAQPHLEEALNSSRVHQKVKQFVSDRMASDKIASINHDMFQKASPFAKSYVKTALWSSTDDDGESLDKNYSHEDIHPNTLKRMLNDAHKFEADHGHNFNSTRSLEKAGHRFWLDRNSAGTGMWDNEDLSHEDGKRLSQECKKYGEHSLIVGDDGLIH